MEIEDKMTTAQRIPMEGLGQENKHNDQLIRSLSFSITRVTKTNRKTKDEKN